MKCFWLLSSDINPEVQSSNLSYKLIGIKKDDFYIIGKIFTLEISATMQNRYAIEVISKNITRDNFQKVEISKCTHNILHPFFFGVLPRDNEIIFVESKQHSEPLDI